MRTLIIPFRQRHSLVQGKAALRCSFADQKDPSKEGTGQAGEGRTARASHTTHPQVLGKPRGCPGLQQPLHAPVLSQPAISTSPALCGAGCQNQHGKIASRVTAALPGPLCCRAVGQVDSCPVWGALPHARVT